MNQPARRVVAFEATQAQPAEMKPDDFLVYLGGLAHGGDASANTDRLRKTLNISSLFVWLTPKEAVPLSIRFAGQTY